jgi:hypothetical protein
MAALYAIWKRLGHIRIGNVNYDIGVKEREDGRFAVSWVCLTCCEQGPPTPAADTVERAIEVAHVGLRIHHSLTHHSAGAITTTCAPAGPQYGQTNAFAHPPAASRSAFSDDRDAFDRLCRASAKRARHAQTAKTSKGKSVYVRNCANWSALAREFNIAIESYGRALEKRANESDADVHRPRKPRPG